MSGRFVRNSKYRHVFGRPTRKEQCYDNLKVSRNAWDTNLVKVNPKHIAVNWDAGGGGAFAVIPHEDKGKIPDKIPLFRGHTAVVLDTDWNPFNDDLIASGSDDGKIFLWRVPDGFSLFNDIPADEIEDVSPVGKLPGHGKKVGHVLFNSAAENVLASTGGDYTVKVWDIESGSAKLNLRVGDVIQSLSWSANGSQLVTTSRDKKLRIWDTRQEKPAHEGPGHAGAKASRAVWMGEHDRIATTGFSKMSERQIALWDPRNASTPVGGFEYLDSSSGICMPFWDDGTQCLYLAGKGDGNIRYYEYTNDTLEYLSEYKSADPQRGMAFMPKRGINMHENEVMRAYKTVHDTHIEPISFLVPRRSETFQDDIYPPAVGLKPAVSGKEWFEGAEGLPPKVSMESLYDGNGLKEASASEIKQVTRPETTEKQAATKNEPDPEPEIQSNPAAQEAKPKSAATRAPPPSMKEQGGSMAAMVGKFQDEKPVEESSDDDSSFEEIQKPNERTSAIKSVSVVAAKDESSAPIKAEEKPAAKPERVPAKTTSAAATPSISAASSSTSGKSVEGLEKEIRDLKTVMAGQTRQLAALAKAVADLVAEVKDLKASR